MGEKESERDSHLLTVGRIGIASGLVATPFLGPFALFAGVGVAIITGLLDYGAEQMGKYSFESPEPKVERISPSYNNSPPYFSPESPETAVARKLPSGMVALLERDSQRKRYVEGLAIGSQIANDYLAGLSSEEYQRVTGIEVIPEQETFFGTKRLEVRIKRK